VPEILQAQPWIGQCAQKHHPHVVPAWEAIGSALHAPVGARRVRCERATVRLGDARAFGLGTTH